MTFLEYVAERLMGPPASRSGGRSTWPCPRHEDNHPSFSTRPPKAGCKDRFQCFSCGFWGDVWDLMREFYPGENYGQHRARVEAWRIEYEREAPREQASYSTRGLGSRTRSTAYDLTTHENPRNVEQAFADLFDLVREPAPQWAELSGLEEMRLLVHAADLAWRNNVSLDTLAGKCAEFILNYRESLKAHAATCNDEDCGDACRAVRGLSPSAKKRRGTAGCNAKTK